MYICICRNEYTYIYIHTHACTYIYIYIFIYVNIYTRMNTHMNKNTLIHMHTHINLHVPTYVHTYSYVYVCVRGGGHTEKGHFRNVHGLDLIITVTMRCTTSTFTFQLHRRVTPPSLLDLSRRRTFCFIFAEKVAQNKTRVRSKVF